MNGLYTLIVQYLGGTYISQCTAKDPFDALDNWVVTFADRPATAKWAALLFEGSDVDGLGSELVPIDGVTNVWYTSIDGANGTAEVQIVLTAE